MKRFAICLTLWGWVASGGSAFVHAQTITELPDTYPVSVYGLTAEEVAPARPAGGWTEFKLPATGNERDTLTTTYLCVDTVLQIEIMENFALKESTVPLLPIGFDFPYEGRTMTHFGLTGNGLVYLGTGATRKIKYESEMFQLSDVIAAKPRVALYGTNYTEEPHFVADAETRIGYYQDPEGSYLMLGIRDLWIDFTVYGSAQGTNVRVSYDLILHKDGKIQLRPVEMKPYLSDKGTPVLYFAYGLFGLSAESVSALDWMGNAVTLEEDYPLNTMAVTDDAEKTVLTYALPVICTVPQDVTVQISFNAYSTDFNATLSVKGLCDGWLAFVSGNDEEDARPEDGKVYRADLPGLQGDKIGGNPVKIFGTDTVLTASGLSPETTCHIYVYPYNDRCMGGPVYASEPIKVPVRLAVGGPVVEVAETTANSVTFRFPDLESETGVLIGVAHRDYRNEVYGSRYEIDGVSGKAHVAGDTLFMANPAPDASIYGNQGPYLITTAYVGKVTDGMLTLGSLEAGTPYYFYFWTALDEEHQYSREYVERGVYTLASTPHTFTFETDRVPIGSESGYLPAGWSCSEGMNASFQAAMYQVGNDIPESTPDYRRVLGVYLSTKENNAEEVRADAVTPAFQASSLELDVNYRFNLQVSGNLSNSLTQFGVSDTLSVWYRAEGETEWTQIDLLTNRTGTLAYAADNFATQKTTLRNIPTGKKIQLRFMIRVAPGSTTATKIFVLHHILVEPHKDCAYPENIAVVDSLVTHKTLGFNWRDNNTPAASIIYRYREAGTGIWSEMFSSSRPTSCEIRNLQQNTAYEVALQSVCRTDSSLVKVITANTLQGLPYEEAVTDLADLPAAFGAYTGTLPESGSAILNKDIYGQGFHCGKYSGEGHTAIGTSFEMSESDKWLTLPVISLEDMAASAQYTFAYKAYYQNTEKGTYETVDAESPFRVTVLVSTDGTFERADSVGVLTVSSMKTDWQTYIVDLSEYTRRIHIALYAENVDKNYGTQPVRMNSYFVLDSLRAFYTEDLPCYAPEDVRQYALTTDGITLSWNGSSLEYGIILKDEDAGKTDTVYTSETTYTLTNLKSGTFYTYRIQGYCEEGHRSPSALSEEGFFTTRKTDVEVEQHSRFAELKVSAGRNSIVLRNAAALWIERVEIYGSNGKMLYGNDFRTDGDIWVPLPVSASAMVLVRVLAAGEAAVYKVVVL